MTTVEELELSLAPSTGRRWVIVLEGERPWTVNGERKLAAHQRARLVRDWRRRTAWLAKLERIPQLNAIRVRACPLAKNRAALQDVGNCHPAVKAAIDGLIDARVITDDTDDIVRELVFGATFIGDVDGLYLLIEELNPPPLAAVAP